MGRNVIVVAHPDDEILWLSSVMARADAVVLCFGAPYGRPEKAENRERAVAHLPIAGLENLALPESGAKMLADWENPELTETGIKSSDPEAQARYEANFAVLIAKLRPILTGATDVYTHNPWGEYGHTEHIQVYRAVQALQAELCFTIWFSNYVAPRTRHLARELGRGKIWREKQTLRTDRAIAHRLMKVYQLHDVWTWSNWHKWPETETLYAQPKEEPQNWRDLRGEVLYNAFALRQWRPIWTAKQRLS